MRLIVIAAFFSFCIGGAPAFGQYSEKPKSSFGDRIFVGGSLGFSFGSVTYIGVAPVVGYQVTPSFSAGIGFSYYYWKDNYYDYDNSIYGGLLFGRYILYKGLFLEADFEANNQEVYTLTPSGDVTTDREWIPSLLLGGGYSQSIGGRSSFFISVLYDVIQDPNSQYYQVPVIRAGFGFGI